MRSKVFTLLAGIGISFSANSQETTWPAWRVSDFQFSIGTEVANSSPIIYPGEISKFVPGSVLVSNGQSDFFGDRSIPSWSSSLLTLQIGLHPMDKVSGEIKNNRTLRLGLTAQGVSTAIYSSHTDTRYRTDTLLNTSTSSVFGFVDSVYHRHVHADYSGTAIKLDASFVWSTDPERRFSLYGGVGVNAGLLIAARTNVSSRDGSSEEITDTRGYLISRHDFESDGLRMEQEQFRNKTGWSASMFLPLGVDLRLAKKKAFWNQLHLFIEMRPSLTILGIPETKTYAVPGIQNTAGFKVHW